jgi:hypothetical protein
MGGQYINENGMVQVIKPEAIPFFALQKAGHNYPDGLTNFLTGID